MEREILNKDWDENEIYTVFGRLNKGLLSNDEGIFKTISYGSFKRQYEGVEGYFNLKYSHSVGLWVIFQCVESE